MLCSYRQWRLFFEHHGLTLLWTSQRTEWEGWNDFGGFANEERQGIRGVQETKGRYLSQKLSDNSCSGRDVLSS